MHLAVLKEWHPLEKRVALDPQSVSLLKKIKGMTVSVEKGAGLKSGYEDKFYKKAGGEIVQSSVRKHANVFLKVSPPLPSEIKSFKEKSVLIGLMNPFMEKNLLKLCKQKSITNVCMEFIPRSTRAQKMDVLSSQASLSGYVSVQLAMEHSDRIFPMMMTPAGTIPPARVFVIGAGVAGLQAIATAKRLGARVEAFDTRPAAAEQIESLGAKALKVDLGESGQTAQGYAKELTVGQVKKQQEAMISALRNADVVIATAQVFGKRAPRIITKKMLSTMRPGAVLVDIAVESGGNIEGSKISKVVHIHAVKIIGYTHLVSRVPINATAMYASNLCHFIKEFYRQDLDGFDWNFEDEILKSTVATHAGKWISPLAVSLFEKKGR